MNRIFHPNIDEMSGTVCLDVINQAWTALYGKNDPFPAIHKLVMTPTRVFVLFLLCPNDQLLEKLMNMKEVFKLCITYRSSRRVM